MLRFFIVILIFIFGVKYSLLGSIEPVKSSGNVDGNELSIDYDEDAGSISVYKNNEERPILIQNARDDFRPYIHPIMAPDGQGVLTQFSPGHHPHQTGLYWGFTRVNGRDFFHNPGEGYWRRVFAGIREGSEWDGEWVGWQTVYDVLDEEGHTLLTETQNWSMREHDGEYILELEWQGEADTDLTIGRYDYGGLFLRVPWREGIPGEVVNSVGDRDQQAEGQVSRWLDLGVQVEGRGDLAHIAIFDHSENKGFPTAWRVDGQMGIGPARTRTEGWHLAKGEMVTLRYRVKIYTGNISEQDLDAEWTEYIERFHEEN